MLQRYAVTPEMLMYRLSELTPTFFELPQWHLLRFQNVAGSQVYHLTKELPQSLCRRRAGLGAALR
jgi:hypothetical protein